MERERRKADPSTALGMTKWGASDGGRHCLRREANTGGKPAYACHSNATRGCYSKRHTRRVGQCHWTPICHPERSRGICFAPFWLHKSLHELQHRTRRGTILSAGMAGKSLVAAKRLLSRPTFLCPSDAGAHVKICGGRKAQSRSLDCARDDKGGASDGGRHCLRREANTGGKPAYACRSNATRGCHSNGAQSHTRRSANATGP